MTGGPDWKGVEARICGVISVLLNSSAGGGNGGDVPARLAHLFAEFNTPAQIRVAENGHHLRHLAEEAAHGPDQIVVGGGGDGSLNTIASALVGTGKALGVLPLGTLNHFAKDAKVPLDLNGAARAILFGKAKAVDVGQVNDRIFLNNSSIGLYPEIVRRRDKEQEKFNRGKWVALMKAFVAALREYRFLHVQISSGGETFRRTTPFVFVGNNQYNLDGFGIGGRESLNSGQLCCWLARRTRPLGLIRLGLRSVVGRLRGARDFEAHCGREFQVTPDQGRVRVAIDGETCFMDTPLTYRSRPGALSLMVPDEAAA